MEFDECGGVHASDRSAGEGFVKAEHWVEG